MRWGFPRLIRGTVIHQATSILSSGEIGRTRRESAFEV